MGGSYRDIIVFLSAGDSAPARLDLAVRLAQQQAARLTGVDVSSAAVFNGHRREQAVGLQDAFEERLRSAGIRGKFRVCNRSDEAGWALYAHYADLVIAPTVGEATAGLVLPAVPEDVLLSAGVPIMVIPELWKPTEVGQRIVVAWNASRESTRALHDAMPLLTRAKAVILFSYDARQPVMREEMDLLTSHLAEHHVTAEPFTWPASADMTPTEALFSCLSERDGDLIVAGGFGHSRRLEHLFGGTSEELLNSLTVPVFMSH